MLKTVVMESTEILALVMVVLVAAVVVDMDHKYVDALAMVVVKVVAAAEAAVDFQFPVAIFHVIQMGLVEEMVLLW
jgi:hypothetical protein